ncbi:MAG: RNA polymerase sigma factor [Myxococcota bacterium]
MAVDVEGLYRQYGPMVLRRCRQLLKNEEAAAEAMQETFIKVLRRRDTLEVKFPSSLLYRIATNTCLNRIRSKSRRPEDADDELLVRIAAAPEPDVVEARDLLRIIFAQEKPSTRTIAVLHLVDGLTLQEVADEVGLSVSGVRKRLRVLKKHVQELEGVR